MTTIRAVDASFHALTADEAKCLKDTGIALFVQALWTATAQPPDRIVSLRNAKNEGLDIAGYISLNRFSSGSWHVDNGRRGVPDDLWEGFKFVAVDVELDGIRISDILAACDRVTDLGQRPIIYTNYQSWTGKVVPPNPTDAADRGIPLWNAYWDIQSDIDFPSLRFGGWRDDQVIGEQWSGGTPLCGTFVDRNTFVGELLYGGGDMAEDAALRQVVTDLKRQVQALNERVDGLEKALQDARSEWAAASDDFDGRLTTVESSPGWQGALAAHAANPDAHHE